jgi:hypothetical protein
MSTTYDWYEIINEDDFIAMDLVSTTKELYLEDVGLKEVLVTRGNYTSLLYEGVFLTANLNSHNPFEFDDHAIYKDDSNNLYLGIKVT